MRQAVSSVNSMENGIRGAALIVAFFCATGLLVNPVLARGQENDTPMPDLAEDEYAPLEDEIPLELDKLEVVGEGLTLKQETGMRMLRQALDRKPSRRKEDINLMVCWYERPTGTRMRYLMCGRNGDIRARTVDPALSTPDGPLNYATVPGYGKIMRSAQPANPNRVKRVLQNLHGSAELDREFVQMSFSGQRPPQDIPSDEELEQFVNAYQEVEALRESGADDDTLEAVINSEGLSLRRYNRIIDLLDTFQGLKNQAQEILENANS